MRLFRGYLINSLFGSKKPHHTSIGNKNADERPLRKPFEYIDDPYYVGE